MTKQENTEKNTNNQANTVEVKHNPSIQGINVQETKKVESEPKTEEKKPLSKEEIIADYENSIRRLQADFENYIKRTEKEKLDFAKYTSAKTVGKFLNIIDSLDMAMIILEKENNAEIKTGIRMIHKQFHKILEEEGVKPMNCKNQKFDPYCHEIIDMVEHETPEGTIVDELQKGYHIHEKVLRTAKVRVSKGKVKKEGAKWV